MVSAFSHFSAVSELGVTAAVFYVLWRAWRHDDVRTGLLAVVLAFEVFVNVAYMVWRIAIPTVHLQTLPSWLLAGHGILSLLMLAGLIAFAVEAGRLRRQKRNLVREHPGQAVGFAVLWGISVASGEVIYAMQLMG
jgi:hypothetical protein